MLEALRKIFNHHEREVRRLGGMVQQINELEPRVQQLSDEELRGQTVEFRQRLAGGATLDDLLPEAFAVVREVAWRVLHMRHFDVQLMGGIVLHEGKIAEMKTGEGKTLVATLPAYLNALAGKGVHIVTVNDYLARRDAEWMGQVYRFLGLDVGVIVHGLSAAERRKAYNADITYGTNNEFGFDYLRDNMVLYKSEMVQRELNYAIIDEVDSILIDEARTPLIISGQGDKPAELYYQFAKVVQKLEPEAHYTVDEKKKTVAPTEEGVGRVEELLGVENLFDTNNMDLSHYLENALRAKALMKRDRDYVVKDGQVIIVDEFTGRLMFGRRYSDGLHQAIEAKEGVEIARESQTLASVTFQNLFRMYDKLAGMTGTAATEEEEFGKIYKLDVVIIPTNEPMIREDLSDVIYKTEAAKFRAVVRDIKERHAKGQPILVGTISIETSERLSAVLKREGIKHKVLNAKYHEQEAEIVAQAGRKVAVTIATNMAGRGTDIVLGGNPDYLARQEMRKKGYEPEIIAIAAEHAPSNDPEVLEARRVYQELSDRFKQETDREHEEVVHLGGLHIIGTERHESRRIDNQLRGRSGRQGDPGSSRFYVSLEDDLMRLFGSDNIRGLMDRLGVEEDEPIEHNLITKALENAQRKVEARNFDIRKHLLDYDDVMNQQRQVIYQQRREVLEEKNLKETVLGMVGTVIDQLLQEYANPKMDPEEWDLKGLIERCEEMFLDPGEMDPGELETYGPQALEDELKERARAAYERKEEQVGSETMRELERVILLRSVDQKWMDHLAAMDELRDGIGLRAYAQRDPLVEYKFEAYEMFQAMIASLQEDVAKILYRVQVANQAPERRRVTGRMQEQHTSATALAGGGMAAAAAGAQPVGPVAHPAPAQQPEPPRQEPVKVGPRVGRNDPCPCGSGKKYKKCHGRDA